ncbi:MAG: hypothetical protein K9L75_04840 [Spirochaetia bacterium]|nr:hypothetical protein [Spirochaetia bacterium]
MKPYFYEGILEKECYKQLALQNRAQSLECSVIIKAKHRKHPKSASILLYDLYIIDKTKNDQSEKVVTVRISPKGYSYKLSHHYHGKNQAFEYHSGKEGIPLHSVEEALSGAAQALFSFYNLNDDKSKWVPSKYYKE